MGQAKNRGNYEERKQKPLKKISAMNLNCKWLEERLLIIAENLKLIYC